MCSTNTNWWFFLVKSLSVLHVITRLDLGGSADNTLLTAIGMAHHGHRATIVCGNSDNPPSLNEQTARSLGISIIRVSELVRPLNPVADIRAALRIRGIIRRGSFDIVHTHTSKGGIVGRTAAVLAGVRTIVHTSHGHIFEGYFPALVVSVLTAFERLAALITKAHIALTEKEKCDYLERRIGKTATFYTVFSGIVLEPYLEAGSERKRLRREFGLEKRHFVYCTVARFVPVKNHRQILGAAKVLVKKLPGARFLWIGDGELRGKLEADVERMGLKENIIFAGWRSDIADILSASDAFVMTSRNEGMGRAFVEAQAAGLPVVGTRVGGIPETMIEGTTGRLVALDDCAGLADALYATYVCAAGNPSIPKACREWVNPRFSVERMVESLEGIYAKLLGETA